MSKPIVATTAVFTFIGVWNDYIWPSMVLPNYGDESWPLLPIQAALTSLDNILEFFNTLLVASGELLPIKAHISVIALSKK